MSLILATGSNLGNSNQRLLDAKSLLDQRFTFIAASRIYQSKAVDYQAQPDFFNQVLEYQLPSLAPDEVMGILLEIEQGLGRKRDVLRGPRTIDLDIIFWGMQQYETEHVVIPHPRWIERSFVVRPLQELPFFKTIEKCFTIPKSFEVEAYPI